MLKIASSLYAQSLRKNTLYFASLAGLETGWLEIQTEIDLKYLNFQKKKKLLCRIISDAAFSWPELMDEGRERDESLKLVGIEHDGSKNMIDLRFLYR